jgi:hypothetical protein
VSTRIRFVAKRGTLKNPGDLDGSTSVPGAPGG